MYLVLLQSGGGILKISVIHTLTVDGYIRANSLNVLASTGSLASGGSGGSIEIKTVNLTGRHKRSI